MTDRQYERADDGRVLSTALAAVLLIAAGLGLLAWDDSKEAGTSLPVSVLQNP